MSNYDAWKTESGDDYEERMRRPSRRDVEPAGAEGGFCACGADTERSVAGVGWQCKPCAELALRKKVEAA